MASEKSAQDEALDPRLAEARDSAIIKGEKILAQETGDQGQAIVLTDSRVLVIKAGMTATGTFNGQRVGAYSYDQISNVCVRKGPMGAVIQLRLVDSVLAGSDVPPDNVVIFSGEQRVKKCRAFATKLEAALGKPITKIGFDQEAQPQAKAQSETAKAEIETPKAEPETVKADVPSEPSTDPKPAPAERRGGREARSLAEEMFAELTESAKPAQPAASASAAETKPKRKPRAKSTSASKAVVEAAQKADLPKAVKAEPPIEAAQVESPEQNVVSEPVQAQVSIPEPAPVEQVIDESPQMHEPEIPQAPASVPQDQADTVVEEAVTVPKYGPNPRLPKPSRRNNCGGKRALALLGLLAAALIVGVAVLAPMKSATQNVQLVEINVKDLTDNKSILIQQRNDLVRYREKVTGIISPSNSAAFAISGVLQSHNTGLLKAATKKNPSDSAWRQIIKLKAPAGLAGAKQNLTSGLFIRKVAIEQISGNSAFSSPGRPQLALKQLSESDAIIKKGLASIDNMVASLDERIAAKK